MEYPRRVTDNGIHRDDLSTDVDGLTSTFDSHQVSESDSILISEVSPREELYSTPLSWEKPLPGFHLDPSSGTLSIFLFKL